MTTLKGLTTGIDPNHCNACLAVWLKNQGIDLGVAGIHREIGGTLGMVPLIINPIYTLYTGYLLGPISPFKGLLGGLNS